MKTGTRRALIVLQAALAAVMFIILIVLLGYEQEPPGKGSQPTVTVQAEPVDTIVHKKITRPARHYAPFCEPLLGRRCWYDDAGQAKVGPRGLKPYEWPDVIVGDEPG